MIPAVLREHEANYCFPAVRANAVALLILPDAAGAIKARLRFEVRRL